VCRYTAIKNNPHPKVKQDEIHWQLQLGISLWDLGFIWSLEFDA
jgi:hypothetical protein